MRHFKDCGMNKHQNPILINFLRQGINERYKQHKRHNS